MYNIFNKNRTLENEIVTHQLIERYLDSLVASFGIRPEPSEHELQKHFRTNPAACISYIKNHMGLAHKIKVTSYADTQFPGESYRNAQIHFSVPIRLGTVIHLKLRESLRVNFHRFVSVIAHEMSHLVLHGDSHALRNSEVATDLCVLVFGFSDFAKKGHVLETRIPLFIYKDTNGYLTEEQLHHALCYYQKLKLRATGHRSTQKETPVTEEPKTSPSLLEKATSWINSWLS